MADIDVLNSVAPEKQHCSTKHKLYVHICRVFDRLYANGRASLLFSHFQRNHAHGANPYIGPTIPTSVGPMIF